MDHPPRAHPTQARIDLAQEPDFAIGGLKVCPSRCEVELGGGRRTLQRRVMQVLVALARPEAEVVSHDELIRRCWGGISVGDDAIGRCIGQLRRLAESWPRPPFEIATIAGVGYRMSASPPGEVATAVEPSDRARLRQVRPALLVAVVALAGLIAWAGLSEIGRPPRHDLRVAVLPFETLSASQDGRFLADRVANDVVDVLAANQVEALSPRDAAGLRGDAAERRGVALLVGGAVQEEGRHAHVTVRLDNARTGVTVWSADFDGVGGVDSSLGEEVAARTADTILMARFARTASPPLTDDAALSAYLEAHNLIRWNRSRDWPRLIADTQLVTAMAPDFAFGHSMLALAYGYEVRATHPPGQEAMIETGRREALRALQIDPQDASAYFALSVLAPDRLAREAVLMKGIAAKGHPAIPYAAVTNTEGELLMEVGRSRAALPYVARSNALDPLSAVKAESMISAYEAVGQFAEAKDLVARALRRWPHHPSIQMARLTFETFYGDPTAAAAALADPAHLPATLDGPARDAWAKYLAALQAPGSRATTAHAVATAGDRRALPRPLAVMMLAQLNDIPSAFDQAAKGADEGGFDTKCLFGPATAALRQDARFWPLARRLGLTDYWRRSATWPDFCEDEAIACRERTLASNSGP